MKEYHIMKLNGELEKIKINSNDWSRLHQDFKGYFKREYSEFFKKYSIEPTIFNLNSLEIFGGVVLTKEQAERFK
jgi:hypothetical protein